MSGPKSSGFRSNGKSFWASGNSLANCTTALFSFLDRQATSRRLYPASGGPVKKYLVAFRCNVDWLIVGGSSQSNVEGP